MIIDNMEILHLMAESDLSLPMIADIYNLVPPEENYIRYCRCFKALRGKTNPETYNLLRAYLAYSVKSDKKIPALFRGLIPKNYYKFIYDIGSGHFEFTKILRSLCPEAGIFSIDKSDIPRDDKPDSILFIKSDIFDFLDDAHHTKIDFSNTLFFMSDFLHCKLSNLSIFRHPAFNKIRPDFLVRENTYSPFIQKRLKLVGGELIDPVDLIKLMEIYGEVEFTVTTEGHYYILCNKR